MSRQKKPTRTDILAAVPLSRLSTRPADPLAACNICGQGADEFTLWLELDENDRPPESARQLVFIGKDHGQCIKVMERHPRGYDELRGEPGYFPLICSPCPHRRAMACSHPDLKANGGAGLRVTLSDPLRGAVLCGSRGRLRVLKHALDCIGLKRDE